MTILLFHDVPTWIPIFVLNDTSYLTWSSLPVVFLLVLLLLITAWLITCAIVVINSVQKLHPTATWIITVLCGGWFECMLGLILIFPYKYGILTVDDLSSQAVFGYEGVYPKEFTVTWKCAPLLIGSFFMWHYVGILCGGIFSFVLERSIATLLTHDYESKPRRWLFISLLLLQQLIALCLVGFFALHIFSITSWMWINAITFAIGTPYIILLRQYNVYTRNQLRLAVNITKHSLAAKYQTEENVRSMNIAVMIIVVATVFDAILMVVLWMSTLENSGRDIFSQCSEIVLFYNPLFVIPAAAGSVKEWRTKFLEFIPISRFRVDPHHNPYVDRNLVKTSQIYFSQLNSLWV